MASAPLLSGLSPAETSFLAESTHVTIIPRQRLPSLPLLSGATPALTPPYRASVPLWLALLLRRQDRAQILAPPWLTVGSLEAALDDENSLEGFVGGPDLGPPLMNPRRGGSVGQEGMESIVLSPPFTADCESGGGGDGRGDGGVLPYHWLEVAHLLLEGATADIPDADGVRRLLRDLRETRSAKLRKGTEVLEGGRVVVLNGVGGLEVSENRAFVAGLVDGLRKIGASKEGTRREREAEEAEGRGEDDDEDEDML